MCDAFRERGSKTEKHYGHERADLLKRCGGRGLRVFAARVPAASDLVAIYKDVGAVLITLSTSSVPSPETLNSSNVWNN
jgi:hypothetical protein